jgi:8-oxo-dGTP pyrophosphatase MutT (NUDIX family)
MYQVVYFGDKPVYLCDEVNQEIGEILHHPETVFIDEFSSHAIKSLLHEIRKPEFHAGVVYYKDLHELNKLFRKHFQQVTAAGGLVSNEKKDLLMIFRKGKWDLPKGKLDDGESLESCAVREVMEETGLRTVTLLHPLLITWHVYDEFGKHLLKESHWYAMTGLSTEDLVPQTNEDITSIEWVPPHEIVKKMSLTYPSVRDVLKHAGFPV